MSNNKGIKCEICGNYYQRLYGNHLKTKHNITTEEYLNRYPKSQIATKEDIENTSKNSGKHMKTDKYRKMFSEKIKGEKNPMHRSKTSEKIRKENSPFSKSFYMKRYNLNEKEAELMLKDNVKKYLNNRVTTTNIEYYLNKGYGIEESKEKLSERQRTFSKDICISKYGLNRGMEIWLARQEKWSKSVSKSLLGVSKISQDLFKSIEEQLPNDITIYYGSKNKEYYLKSESSIFKYDFTLLDNKKIIEYHGNIFHANPLIYEKHYKPNPFNDMTSEEIWKMDKIKEELALDNNFEYLVIWESEYNSKSTEENKEKVIRKCLNFLSKGL